jgi:hypothetical protein
MSVRKKLGAYVYEVMTRPGPPQPLWWGADLPRLTPSNVGELWAERRRRTRQPTCVFWATPMQCAFAILEEMGAR